MIKIYKRLNNQFIGNVQVANTLLTRSKGLLGTSTLNAFEGLWIIPCRQVHTFFMKYPLSIWFLDQENKIAEIIDNLKPYRTSPCIKTAYSIIEFPESWGKHMGCAKGDFLDIVFLCQRNI